MPGVPRENRLVVHLHPAERKHKIIGRNEEMSFSVVGMGTLLANVSLLSVITTENVLYTESSLRMSG